MNGPASLCLALTLAASLGACRETPSAQTSQPAPAPASRPDVLRPRPVSARMDGGVARPALPRVLYDAGRWDAVEPPEDASLGPPPSGRAVDLARVPPGRGWWCYRFTNHERLGGGDPCRRARVECENGRNHEVEEHSAASPCEARDLAYCTTFLNANNEATAFCRESARGCNAGARALAYEVNEISTQVQFREISDCDPVP